MEGSYCMHRHDARPPPPSLLELSQLSPAGVQNAYDLQNAFVGF